VGPLCPVNSAGLKVALRLPEKVSVKLMVLSTRNAEDLSLDDEASAQLHFFKGPGQIITGPYNCTFLVTVKRITSLSKSGPPFQFAFAYVDTESNKVIQETITEAFFLVSNVRDRKFGKIYEYASEHAVALTGSKMKRHFLTCAELAAALRQDPPALPSCCQEWESQQHQKSPPDSPTGSSGVVDTSLGHEALNLFENCSWDADEMSGLDDLHYFEEPVPFFNASSESAHRIDAEIMIKVGNHWGLAARGSSGIPLVPLGFQVGVQLLPEQEEQVCLRRISFDRTCTISPKVTVSPENSGGTVLSLYVASQVGTEMVDILRGPDTVSSLIWEVRSPQRGERNREV